MLKPICKICAGRWRDNPQAVRDAIFATGDSVELRIGYTRKSDESVSSSVWTEADGRMSFVDDLRTSSDISAAWVRCQSDVAHYFVG